ncbi:MAG: glycosyltransferase family 4 protein [Alphaproteobacteria bacterium]|nr:MAG: glycosyltransferase family 4 protein [Alphaproteobacteria bacterium]
MRILCVHQGYELYGSDRAFIDSVAALREAWPQADIEVVLPHDGPICAPLRASATRIAIEPLLILRRRGLAKLIAAAPLRIVPALWRAVRRMRSADLVYVNTVVVLDYLLAARAFSRKTLVHVHEIPDGRKLQLFRQLLRWTRAEVIFNSKATRAAYRLPAACSQHVVYNGIAAPAFATTVHYDGKRPLRLLMLGRISRIKGQDLLIAALAQLPQDITQRLEVRIVGDSFQNDVVRETALRQTVSAAGLDSVVRFEPFRQDTAPLYRWADVVAVPSRLPESLGRVAIEAMAHGRPPLVVRLGGLPEVVEDRVTGWIVPPNDATALARTVAAVVTDPEGWRGYGAAARVRFETMFAAASIARQLQSIVRARFGTHSIDAKPSPSLAYD